MKRPSMRTIVGLDAAPPELVGGVLSIGNFDGVHRGHQRILHRTAALARELGVPSVAMTFDPHPLSILQPHQSVAILTPLVEKLAQIAACGVDFALVAKTGEALLSLDAGDFVDRVIVEQLGARAVVEGASFHYGHERAGNANTLQAAGAARGFVVAIVDPVTVTLEDGQRETISSSRIRRAIAEHDLPLAMRALGRPYTLVGRVVHGKGRGRRLGFPTANLDLGRQMIPPNGVYAGKATLGNEKYLAAISIGHAPTFADVADAFVEAHLLDFDREVYGQVLRVEVHHWLRAQAAYGSAQALCDQMAEDVRTVRRMVRDTPGEAA